MENQKIIIGVNCVPFKDKKALHRQNMALKVLLENKPSNADVINFCYPNENMELCKNLWTLPLQRNSREEIGNQRPLPYIKEIMDALASLCGDGDVFGYINSDILLTKNFFKYFKKDADAYIFSRTEITDIYDIDHFNNERYKALWGGDTHAGADGFFFRKEWWEENQNHFSSELILGETEWDTVYRHLILNLTNNYVHERALLHVYHNAKWDVNSIGGKNNTEIWEQVKNDYA